MATFKREERMKKNMLLLLILALGLGMTITMTACSCGDDDDDDNNDAADDDNDSGDDDNDDVDDDDDDNDTGDDDDDNDDNDDNDTSDTTPPVITNTLLLADTDDTAGPYVVTTDVEDDVAIDTVALLYRVDGGAFTEVAMTAAKAPVTYTGEIPGQAADSFVEYYIVATDTSDNEATDPGDAPTTLYSFTVYTVETFITDDGTSENGWNGFVTYGDNTILAKKLEPSDYPARLTEAVVYLTETVTPVSYEVVIYEDTTGGAPDDATEIWTTGVIATDPATWPTVTPYAFDVADELDGSPLTAGYWLVGVRYHGLGLYLASDETVATPDPLCYAYEGSTGNWAVMSVAYPSFAGTFMVRGTANIY
jgi:hypothetical protein